MVTIQHASLTSHSTTTMKLSLISIIAAYVVFECNSLNWDCDNNPSDDFNSITTQCCDDNSSSQCTCADLFYGDCNVGLDDMDEGFLVYWGNICEDKVCTENICCAPTCGTEYGTEYLGCAEGLVFQNFKKCPEGGCTPSYCCYDSGPSTEPTPSPTPEPTRKSRGRGRGRGGK